LAGQAKVLKKFIQTFCHCHKKLQKGLDKSMLQRALINFGICQSKRVNFFDENSQNLSFTASAGSLICSGLRSVSPLARLGLRYQHVEVIMNLGRLMCYGMVG